MYTTQSVLSNYNVNHRKGGKTMNLFTYRKAQFLRINLLFEMLVASHGFLIIIYMDS